MSFLEMPTIREEIKKDDADHENYELTCDDFERMAKMASELRTFILFSLNTEPQLFAQQHYLKALASLEQADFDFQLAALHQARETRNP